MKQGIITALFLIATFPLQAQIPHGSADNKQGDQHLNFGVGTSGWGLPLYFQYEKMLYSELSLGGEGNFRINNEKYNNVEYSHKMIALGVVGNYYFDKLIELPAFWDLYAGASLGYIHVSTTTSNNAITYTGKRDSGIYLGIHLGSRYYFSNRWAINGELEFATTLGGLKLGATYRF